MDGWACGGKILPRYTPTMTSERHLIAFLLAMALALPSPALAIRQGRLIGKVLDPEGKPIAGVTVTATCKDIPDFKKVMTTDAKGVFKVDFDRINVVYHYRFEKAGYLITEAEQTWSLEGTERYEFTMHPGEAPALDYRPPASVATAAFSAFNEGARAFEAKDYPTARARFEEALRHDPHLRPAWSALSMVLLEEKSYRKAAEAAERAIALGDTDPSVLRARWEAYRNLGDGAKAQQAREELEKAGRLQEEAKRIHNEGVALSKRGDDERAFARFQEAVEIDPNLHQAWLALAVSGLKVGRAAEAAAAAKRMLEANAQDEEALRIQYNAALQLGDEARIVEALLALAPIDPTTARDNLFKLAAKAFDADDAARAKERFIKVLELDPNHPRSHYYLGLLFVREKATKDARSHLERFVRLAPNDPDVETAKGLLSYLAN
jgi:Tfp pilus assembly protein PilF